MLKLAPNCSFIHIPNGVLASFPTLSQAISFTLQAQISLMAVEWPEAFLSYNSDSFHLSNGKMIWNGLRVRMAMHTGVALGDVQEGPVVNKVLAMIGMSCRALIRPFLHYIRSLCTHRSDSRK